MARILVVEDEPDLRMLLQVLLASDGHEVVEAGTAEDALPLIHDADVVLLDIRLPGMSGLDLVDKLDVDVRSRIMLMSAHADPEFGAVARDLGCAGFLPKPFAMDTLVAQVSALTI